MQWETRRHRAAEKWGRKSSLCIEVWPKPTGDSPVQEALKGFMVAAADLGGKAWAPSCCMQLDPRRSRPEVGDYADHYNAVVFSPAVISPPLALWA